MNTLKSAALVVIMLGVLYGVYVALSKPLPNHPQSGHSAEEAAGPAIEYTSNPGSSGVSQFSPSLAPAGDVSPAANNVYAPRGGYQPALDTNPAGSLPPPMDPTAAADIGLRKSAYESPAISPATPESATNPALDTLTPASGTTAAAGSAPSSSSSSVTAFALRRDMQEAEQLVTEGKFKSALAKLSAYYNNSDLDESQRAQLLAWLDPLAGKVIYSREHLLSEPHTVRGGETLYDIAAQNHLSWLLLRSIENGSTASNVDALVPGTELKVLPGPFRAEVNLVTSELTLFIGDLYAGRFPFALGDQPPSPGQYKVQDKRQQERTYYGLDGRVVPANDPANPYGGWWISLGGEVCIHGSPLTPSPKTLGCLSLSPQDAQDVYSILSMGSDVTIRR